MTVPAMLRALALLLEHDVRLGWRDFRSTFRVLGDKAFTVLVAILMLVMHVAAWSATRTLFGAGHGAEGSSSLAAGLAFVMLLMTAQTLNGLTRTLYGRGDLDLILSSPFPVRAVLLVRALSAALGAGASAAIFVLPVADVGLLQGQWWCLALYPALAAGALAATATSLLLAMAMFAVLGARRTRLAAQILATFIGGGFMLWLQISRFSHAGAGLISALDAIHPPAWLQPVLGLPLRAATSDGEALLLWVALCLVFYGLTTVGLGPMFARSALAAASAPHGAPGLRRIAGKDRSFATSLGGCLRRKEFLLLRRDPWILSQLLLQILYMTPMLVMLWNGGITDRPLTVALAPLIVVVAYQVTASMTWLSLSGEDAPELLATAPVSHDALQIGKLVAVGQITAMLAALPLLWLALLSWRVAGVTVVLAALAAVMAMLLSLWHSKPAKRSGFAARHRESKLLALMEMVMSMLLGVSGAFVAVGSAFAVVPLGIAALILLANRPRRAAVRHLRPSADHDQAAGPQPGQQPA